MAQVVIFAPPDEDVSAGEQALKDAGHDVEVVEATAENLLHMAIGMLEGKEPEEKEPEEKEEPEEPAAEEEPETEPETEDALAEPAEEPAPEKMESLGHCTIDGERVLAVRGTKTCLFVQDLQQGEKTTFTLGESIISTWQKTHRFFLTTPKGEMAGATAPVYRSKFGKSYLSVGPELAHFF